MFNSKKDEAPKKSADQLLAEGHTTMATEIIVKAQDAKTLDEIREIEIHYNHILHSPHMFDARVALQGRRYELSNAGGIR